MRKNLRVGKNRQLFPRRIPSGLAVVVCAAAFLLITVPGQAQPALQVLHKPALQVLHKHVRPAVTSGRAAPVGFLPSTQGLNLVIHLPVRNQDELTSLIDRLSDPTSPDYRRWLSVAEFTARFGRTEAEYQKAADFAEANGFAVTYKSPNRLMLVVRGSVAQIEKAFNVKMRTYQVPAENRIFYSPDREPSFALDVPVSHISGLNNYSYPHPAGGPRPAQLGAGDSGGPPQGTGSGPNSSFLGSDMRAAYNMGSNTGAGQAVGLAEFSGYTASDVSLYFSNINQTNNVPIANVVVDGGSAGTWSNANDEGEVCLDIEQAVSVAPGLSQLLVYIGPTSFGTGVDGYIFSRMATDNIAKQLSNSWWWYPDDPATDDPYFEEMATQGQTFFNISGDNGAYTGHSYEDMGYPAEDTHLTVVGGTALTTYGPGGPWQSEVAWNDGGQGSGGGPADDGTTYFPIQSWQIPVINSSNGGSTTLRNSPDVALQADFDNYICYDRGRCQTDWGGTSFAAPRWAAWFALVNQQAVANGQTAGLGFINPALYLIGQSSGYNSDFQDITSGNNDTNGQSTFYYAVAGYDLVTGWGSMNGQALMAALLTYTLTVSTSGNGTVTSTDGFINCPGTCSQSYPGNTQVTLNATPAAGWTFSGWSGACGGTGPCVVTMTQNLSVGATFTQLSYTLTVSTSGNGTVTSTDGFISCPGTCSHIYLSNTPVTLNASPALGWSFSGWTGACTGSGSCNLTMTQNQSVTATFTQDDYTLTVSIGGNGTVTSTDGYINCPGTCSHIYLSNTPVTLNAFPAQSWIFSGWTGACSGVGSCNVTMPQNLSVTAIFVEPGNGLQFTPVTPCRLVDTRQNHDPIQGGTSRDFAVSQLGNCGIPTTAAAYSLNVTVVPYGRLGYLTIWPSGEAQPYISTLNSPDGRIKANAAIVPAGTSGAVSVYVTDTTDVLLDIDGYFAPPASQTYQFYPLPPCRVMDTRNSNMPQGLGPPALQAQLMRVLPVLMSPCFKGVSQPQAYSLNFTVVPNPQGQPLAYLTVWPEGDSQPEVSTLNNSTATVVANAAIVQTGQGGELDVFAEDSTDLIIDTNGYFAAPGTGGLSMYPAAPCRVLDTRQNNGQPFMGEKTVNVVGSVCAPPSSAEAYIFNATVAPPGSLPYLTLWPDGEQQPVVSTLNAYDGFITSNMAIVPTANGSIDAYADGLTQLILDISSYFAP